MQLIHIVLKLKRSPGHLLDHDHQEVYSERITVVLFLSEEYHTSYHKSGVAAHTFFFQ